jgi:SAM-dependent methyltransferase
LPGVTTDVPAPGYYEFLDFNAPLSGARADSIASTLARARPSSALDIGCGWAELLLRILSASKTTTGVGIDTDGVVLERARRNARQRGLHDRIRFVEGVAPTEAEPVDLVLCVGSDHSYRDQRHALQVLRRLTNPGGRVLWGTMFWETPPTQEQARAAGIEPDALPDLDGLVDLATNAGFRPLWTQTANRDEWESFESGYLADWEEWLHRYGEQAAATEIRQKADGHRKGWLAGYRNVLGFAYLTLGR